MATKIEKENIHTLNIIPASTNNTQKWTNDLNYAVRLGNEYKGKTVITFNTDQGAYVVETTVWSVTEKMLLLKGGVSIPLNSIIDIHF